ncbi:MAG TPA: FAD-dependent oxidoreductase, partial [Arenimonas sp.]|nr:FAD-dependent oxidoreductase [Arenimonas sp.]
MSRRGGLDLIVIGAGVVGSAAALGAARQGLSVALVEAQPAQAWQRECPDLRVYALAADNRVLLQSLGVWPAVAAARAQAYRRMRVWDAAGGGELLFDADALGVAELGHIVENDLLVDRLGAALLQQPTVQRYCPDSVVGLQQDGTGVQVELQSGTRLRARLLLAADGAASQTRERLGIGSDRHDYQQRGLVAFVRCEQAHQDTAWQRFLPTGPLAFLPFTEGRSSIVWTLPEDEAIRLRQIDEAAFRRELSRAFDARLGDVLEVGERAAFPLRRQLAERFVEGRVLLLGDAAHAVHPLAGQGVNIGLRDVSALIAMLARVQSRGGDIAAAHHLQRWARERRSDSAIAAYAFEGINR